MKNIHSASRTTGTGSRATLAFSRLGVRLLPAPRESTRQAPSSPIEKGASAVKTTATAVRNRSTRSA
jgi:hypothetical protein